MDCLAQGEPKPVMRWEKLDSDLLSVGLASRRLVSNGGPLATNSKEQVKNQLVSRK